MKNRTIKKLFKTHPTIEGAGVHLNRVFAQPEVPQFDPFLLLDDFGSENPEDYIKGFPWHPHRGIETVTFMKSGEVEHQDSLGNKGVIKAGDVQWMTAGSGIVHQEMPQLSDTDLKGLQLWVNLPKDKKMTKPTYRGLEDKDIPKTEKDNCAVSVIAGEWNGVKGPADRLNVDVRYFDVQMQKDAVFTYDVPSHFTVFVYVYEGSILFGNEEVIEKEYAALTNEGEALDFKANKDGTKCIVVAGEPIGEEIAWGGPIVMNTDAEVQQAFWEYQNNEFIK
jgi:redox-sensitive bicupin YhaK (pirin superfamily)